ncbi:MAG: hypothetical protein FD141_601 [Fusobacteria bacterium]|nr:MAG: hypothetical protein FD141_601 [Fusobacteriota bacterium]KAF0228733.1 MAG: hypothetical protein FD182_989 [Fusobacteriota bacterium]
MKIGIGIFAKTIGHSRVKTRLAEGIGQKLAEEFYSLSVKAVEEVVIRYSSIQKYNAMEIYWARPSGKYDICTKGLGLGAAMHKVAKQILKECDAYILIGTDTPQINGKTIDTVLNIMKEDNERIIFGPSRDGGFYLMAGTSIPTLDIMESVTYSQEDTLEQLLKLIDTDSKEYTLIEELSDVDIVDDLEYLRISLEYKIASKDKLLESQKSILEWLNKRNLA